MNDSSFEIEKINLGFNLKEQTYLQKVEAEFISNFISPSDFYIEDMDESSVTKHISWTDDKARQGSVLSNESTQISSRPSSSTTLSENKVCVRKQCPDGIHKKLKVDFHRYLLKKLNKQLKNMSSNLKFGKFSQELVIKVDIKYCKELVQATLRNILKKDPGNQKEKKCKNKEIIKQLEDLPLSDKLKEMLDSTYGDLFNRCYLQSMHYQAFLKTIEKEECSEYMRRLHVLALGFTDYYLMKSANKRAKSKNKKKSAKCDKKRKS